MNFSIWRSRRVDLRYSLKSSATNSLLDVSDSCLSLFAFLFIYLIQKEHFCFLLITN